MTALLHVLSQSQVWGSTVTLAAPLVLAAIGGTISERSGVINIGMEGMMLIGAFASAFFINAATYDGRMSAPAAVAIGIAACIAAGAVSAFILTIACVYLRANQIVVGIALDLLALGLTNFLFVNFGNLPGIPVAPIPGLRDIGFLHLGTVIFYKSPLVYGAILLVPLTHLILFHTKVGLRIRAVGENPRAAESAGIGVLRLRTLTVLVSGALCGLAGGFLVMNGDTTHGVTSLFSNDITQGLGFIALAAVVVGRWTPFGAAAACLVFGFGEALSQQTSLVAAAQAPLLAMLPYLLTIVVAAGLIGRASPPAADGIPYDPVASE